MRKMAQSFPITDHQFDIIGIECIISALKTTFMSGA